MNRKGLVEGVALLTAVAAGAGVAAGVVSIARGETTGAPGITRGLSRLGHLVGGSMLAGVSLAGGSAALVGVAVYQNLRRLSH